MEQAPGGGGGRAPLASLANRPELWAQPGSAGKARPAPQDFTQYHTGWMDKQEAAFQAWLNTVLAPAPVDTDGSSEGGGAAGHRGLALRRLTARLRGLLWQLYSQDQELVSVMLKVEQRIDGGQLKLRDEESLMKNVKEAANARAVLACYQPLWLRLGVEVVVGKAVAANDGPVSAAELGTFVREHFFKDPQLARQHPGSGKAYWVALARLVLKRFLLLAALLDRAAQLPALQSAAPLLFRRDSKLKTSVQVLTEFVLPRLAGEGDVVRTLGRLGYKLSYVQDPRRELDFAVSNMATDLRDGLRLCKLAELLTNQHGLFDGTRFPSDRRPVRVANMQLALEALARAGLPLQGAPRSAARGGGQAPLAAGDLVDGDREMTLCLLWRLIQHFQLPQLISLAAIRAEVELVQAKAPAAPGCTDLQPSSASDAAEAHSPHSAALLSWVQAVCAYYGLPVRSFGACFGDGSAFCLLIHHYLGHSYIALKDVYRSVQPAEAAEKSVGWAGGVSREQVEGARRNFTLVQGVVQSLGGIPAMVSAEDFVEHGYDEKGCILFTAFLCQRLLEISKEERAALVIQRQWRNRQQHKPGTAREHLHRWIAAASRVQRAARAWLLRRGLERFAERRRRGVAAVVRLQALWRAREPYRQYQAMRQAAITVQAAYRGKLARQAVFHTLVVPRMLEAGLRRKRQIEASRYHGRLERAATLAQALWRGRVHRRTFLLQRSAAVAIQAAVRGWQQQRCYQQQRAAAIAIQFGWRRHRAMCLLAQTKAAVVLQKHYRSFVVRKQLAQQAAAATAVQAAWRCWHARHRFLQQRAAAVAVQTAWRAHQARVLLQQHKAARSIQAVWRGHAVRQQVAQQETAAVRIQAAWRRFAARRAFLQQRQAAVCIQAAVRCHIAQARFQQQRAAALRIQAAFRGFAVRHLLQRNQAATAIQSHVRGFLVRRRLERERVAAVTIQRAVRAHQERRRQVAVAAVKQQMAEMAALMREYQRRTASALRIQAAYRGHKGRCEYRCLLAAREELRRQQAEREAAALAVIAPWAETFKARTWFLRARRAAPVLQAWWRHEFARRREAAVAIQAIARGWLVRRHLQRSQVAAVCVQTAWRGWHVRETHPRRKQLADIRARLAAATINAANAPHRTLGARTHAFLDALLASKHPTSATAALNGLALCTEAVLACSDIVVAGGGLPVLLGIAKAPGRGKEAAEALRATLACLANICRSRQHGDTVFAAEGLLPALGDHLQQQRDKEDVFMAVVALWQRLVCGQPARALALARQPEVLSKLEGVARLLSLKLDGDKKYLTKLEQQKGSDVSARQATKALLAGQRQLRALRAVLAATGASREAGTDGGGAEEELRLGKNTLVRAVLREHK